jgi:hypothetical protein
MNFTRAVDDWEVEAFASFFRMLYLARMRQVGKGRTSCGGLHPKRVCLVLNLSTVSWVVMIVFFPWKSVWWTKVPLRVAFLCGQQP